MSKVLPHFNLDRAYNYWVDSVNKVEIGHYEDRYNINDFLCDEIPNDYYADGVVFAIMQPDMTCPYFLDKFNIKVKIEYQKVKVRSPM